MWSAAAAGQVLGGPGTTEAAAQGLNAALQHVNTPHSLVRALSPERHRFAPSQSPAAPGAAIPSPLFGTQRPVFPAAPKTRHFDGRRMCKPEPLKA